jgi:integrase
MRITDLFESQYRIKKLRGRSQNTVRLYRICFRHLARTLGREPLLSDLTDEIIKKHLQRLLNEGRSKATVNKERCSIVAVWRYACQKGFVDAWPDVPKQKEPERTPIAWMQTDVRKLIHACENTQGTVGKCPAGLFWGTLVRVCLDTGERIGALMQSEWSWLDNGSLNIRGEVRKGGKRDKWFQLSPEANVMLDEMRKYKQSDYIFHWPYCPTYVWNRYGKILERAGLPTGRKCGWHRIRKTSASVAYQAGLDPQELLDHQDRRTTAAYLDPRYTRSQQASDVIADWLRNPPTDLKRKQA